MELLDESALEYAPVVARPEKILCIGLNYVSHIEEVKVRDDLPKYPEVFAKTNNALAAHKQPFKMPRTAGHYDYEAELVIVMGRECSEVSKEKALDYVFGYTCGNDITSRELQKRGLQWFMGKSLDASAPVGPHIVTADSLDPSNLDIVMKRGDDVVQSSNTSKLLFDCAYLVSYISQYMVLKPGDLILTGTPSGVIGGKPPAEQKWLEPGEMLTVSIEGIGDLVNTTV
jgi:2-keto-4-pentenoate hydratase/2-oxohepta-3-ene-1,7-dioic acid hydratase in catechol pathway